MARKPIDDDEDDDLDDAEPARADDAAADDGAGDLDDGPAEYEGEDDDDRRGGGLGRLILIAGVALAFIVGVAAGGYFFIFSGDEETEVAAKAESEVDSGDGTTMSIPRRRMMTADELGKKGGDAPVQSASPPAPAPGGAFTPPPASQQPAPAAPAAQQQTMAPPPAAVDAAPKAQPPAKGKGKAAPAPVAVGEPSGAGLVTPAVTAAAYREIPILPQGKPLTGPIASLIESTDAGQLPKMQGSNGPWRAYARPFDGPAERPKIAIIVTGMGLSRAPTLAAVNQLPGGITLAFDPYAKNTDEWVGLGRSNGHEAVLHLPLETNDFPVSDPGPLALLTDLDALQNLARMHQVLASAIGYVGVIQIMGSRFATSDAAMRPVLEEAKRRGLMFVSVPATNDDRGMAIAQEISLPIAQVDLKIDAVPSATAIDARLSELEKIARERGSALGIAEALPVTIAKLAAWTQTLDFKELALAPVTAVVPASAAPAAAKGAAKSAAKK
jgi:uncharacterized protein